MSTTVGDWYQRYLSAHDVAGLEIPITAVKLFTSEGEVPQSVRDHEVEGLTLTSCQATKQASLGDAVCLTRRNIGCVAAAVSLGLADEREDEPLL